MLVRVDHALLELVIPGDVVEKDVRVALLLLPTGQRGHASIHIKKSYYAELIGLADRLFDF